MLAMRCARRVLQPAVTGRPIGLALPVRRFAKLSPDMKKKGGTLALFTEDLTARAKEGKIDNVIG
eukprot:COSAG02_NODE_63870_length_262_cov_0.631902_1_plen_64_part_10